jgi:hypothetical protein
VDRDGMDAVKGVLNGDRTLDQTLRGKSTSRRCSRTRPKAGFSGKSTRTTGFYTLLPTPNPPTPRPTAPARVPPMPLPPTSFHGMSPSSRRRRTTSQSHGSGPASTIRPTSTPGWLKAEAWPRSDQGGERRCSKFGWRGGRQSREMSGRSIADKVRRCRWNKFP